MGKIERFGTHNLPCRKFAAVCQKFSTSCSVYFLYALNQRTSLSFNHPYDRRRRQVKNMGWTQDTGHTWRAQTASIWLMGDLWVELLTESRGKASGLESLEQDLRIERHLRVGHNKGISAPQRSGRRLFPPQEFFCVSVLFGVACAAFVAYFYCFFL